MWLFKSVPRRTQIRTTPRLLQMQYPVQRDRLSCKSSITFDLGRLISGDRPRIAALVSIREALKIEVCTIPHTAN